VCVRDLGSKNGTWLLVPTDRTVRVAESEVVIHLARAADDASSYDEPPAASWKGRRDFAPALAEAMEAWLRRQGVDVRVGIVPPGREGSDPPTRIPLSTGEGLDIAPLATAHTNWSRLVERLWRWVARQNSLYEAEEEARGEGLILASRAIRGAHREVVDAAQAGARTLLLTGPSGAGKEVLAEIFHRHSGRSGPFVAVNCSMFSKDLLRTELFGAAAGAFTDGKQRILGAVERAQGGTLFLDEVGEMSLDVQPMLLRFLDRREFQSLGQYGRTQRADVRVVAATNRNLRDAVRSGLFRADLWYRLSVHVVDVPALRSRWEDVLAYLETIALEGGRSSMRDALSSEALELLRTHPWDGNFRELTNFTERLSRHPRPGSIDAATCLRALERGALHATRSAPAGDDESPQADWSSLVTRAMRAFVEDHGHEPRTWDDQKEWNEKYLKPLLFFHMSGATQLPAPLDESALASLASQVASRMQADRGTAAKQLTRYFERFRSDS
jgi:DNA-binding NtrC family response regulator